MKIQMVVREDKYFVKVKCSQTDERADNGYSAVSAFVNALAIAWNMDTSEVAEQVASQLELLRKKKKTAAAHRFLMEIRKS